MQNYNKEKRNKARDKMELKILISLLEAARTRVQICYLYIPFYKSYKTAIYMKC